jgi:Na+-driven multidrug efflux pump
MYLSFGSGVLNLILNYYLIYLNGIVGAAQATFCTFAMMFVLIFYYSNKYSELTFFGFLEKA